MTAINPAMAVAVYLRVSTEEQRERQSIETQREFAEKFCQLHSLAVYRVYADDGISGTVPIEKRPLGSQIFADAKQGRFNQLLVYRLDRFGRDTRLILNAVDELEKLGVRVRSMTEEFDTGSATGRLMLTFLSGFASHERDVIRERSVAGTRRLAESGAWMGGIVPFGYRKVGENKNARLVISEAPIADVGLSEAGVIQLIYRMAAVERKSCCLIAQRLNELKVPCAYVRDDRLVQRGKRHERTSGVWRPGRVRNLIVSTTYKGLHEWGKRSNKRNNPLIVRAVPAIVAEETWQKAQATLRSNFLFARRNNTKNRYLLRGMIKCGSCGLSYCGQPLGNNGKQFYYTCNGYHGDRGAFGKSGKRCPSKAVRGDLLEAQIWSDVERFLRDPGPVLEQLQTRLETESSGSKLEVQLARLEDLAAKKADERSRVVALFRRGRINETDVDEQMAEIGVEESALQVQIRELRARVTAARDGGKTVGSAQALLTTLRKRLDSPVSWERKRELIEVLVGGIRVDTFEVDGVRQNKISVTYRFNDPGGAMPLVFPQIYSVGAEIRVPAQPKTVGDHIRKKRLVLKLHQKDVAKQVGCTTTAVCNWETNTTTPDLKYIPAIIQFLGYSPLPEADDWGGRLLRARTIHGMSQKEAARKIGVDPSTLARWESGEREPAGKFEQHAKRFIEDLPIGRRSRLAS